MIWADNEPFFTHANLILKNISLGCVDKQNI